MSNDVAYPVFRTFDLGLALSTARRLMEFGRREDSRLTAYAELCSVAEVQRVTCELDDLPIGRIEDVFAAAIGPSRGWINWEWLCWPDAPEPVVPGYTPCL
ncbi:hypothetical protein [Streptomyces cyaneofuscatus]|uniref:hypothetical protein n=1 Tax=Streptomyces cyaneofuscatus TaxID=66883 RepID=UPI0037F32A0A